MKTNYQNAGMLDMIFEHRNKSYGAYALRSNYNNRISQALLITLSAVFLLCFGKFISDKLKGNTKTLSGHIVILDVLPEIHLPDEDIKVEPPKPVEPPQSQAINTIRDPEMNVVANNQIADSLPTNDELANAESGLITNINDNKIGTTDGKGIDVTFEVAPSHVAEPEPVRNWAEVMPKFPGGDDKLMEFVSKKTVYPERERDLEIEGKALVRFVVNEDGGVSDAKIMKSSSGGFSKEAMRVVALLPKFAPGLQQGQPVKVQFIPPFQFTLAQ